MNNQFQLITLFQQNNKPQVKGSGYKYKLLGGVSNEIDVPFESFTDFTDGLLSYIKGNMDTYYENKENSIENDEDFISTSFGSVLLEKIDKFMTPIIVDINFEFTNNDAVSFYHDKFIYQSVYCLQDIMLGVFQVPHNDDGLNKILTCFVMETDPWVIDDKQYVSIRIQFPFSRVNLESLNRIIIPKFRNCIIQMNMIKKLVHETPLNIDRLVPDANEYVSMYGCKRNTMESLYFLRGVYSYIMDYERLNDDYDNEMALPFYIDYDINDEQYNEYLNYINLFSRLSEDQKSQIKRPDHDKIILSMNLSPFENTLVKSKLIDDNCIDITQRMYNLPLILSVHFCSDILKLDDNISMNQPIADVKTNTFDQGAAINNENDRFQQLSILLPMISKSRFTEYFKYDWLSIGKAIHTIYNGHMTGLAIFQHYTDDVYLKSMAEEYYNNFCSELLDIRTIKHYANCDNPEMYKAFCKSLYYSKIVPALDLQELTFAKFASEILCLDFVYDRNNDTWFYFDGTRLVKDTKAYILIDYLAVVKSNPGNDKVIKALYDFKDEMIAKSREASDRYSKNYFDGYEKGVTALIKKMGSMPFLKKIIEGLQVCMYDDYLYKKTDENADIMACKDCVLECIDDTIVNRPGKLQDYITKSTNISFPTTFTINHPKVQFMLRYYSQVHCSPDLPPGNISELCHYFLKTLGSLLKGGNAEKFFINWIGEANASKSQVLKFLQAALGDYCVILPNHIITLNINSNTGKPEPALERAKGSRAAIAAETDRSEKWHVGHVKKYTSGDDYDNRTLNKEGGERSASFQLIAMSNIDLDAPNADEAYYSRYVKIPFLSKWVDNAPLTEIEQYKQRRFPIDLSFSTKIKYYAQAQLWLMFHYYTIYKKEGIRVLPEVVKTVTLKHQRDIDVIFNFIHDRLQMFYIGDPKDKIPDKNKKSSVFDLHRIYKSWYYSAYGRDVAPLDQFKFRDEIARRIGNSDDQGFWYGISVKQLEISGSL